MLLMLVSLAAPAAPPGPGEAVPELAAFLKEKVGAIQAALDETPEPLPDKPHRDVVWGLGTFFIAFRAAFGISIPPMVELQIMPELKLTFKKKP